MESLAGGDAQRPSELEVMVREGEVAVAHVAGQSG